MGFSTPTNQFIKPIVGLMNINVTINLKNYPAEMKKYKQWVSWSSVKKKDQAGNITKAKIPVYISSNGKLGMAKWKTPNNWYSFVNAKKIYDSSDLVHGVGFVFSDSDPFVFIDFDHLEIDDERYEHIRSFDSFKEWSQSGEGIHIIAKGKLKGPHIHNMVEMYSNNRFCAMTGHLV